MSMRTLDLPSGVSLADLVVHEDGYDAVVAEGATYYPIRMPSGGVGYSNVPPLAGGDDFMITGAGVARTEYVTVDVPN